MGHTKRISHLVTMIERSQMRHYHEKLISCQKGLDVASIKKLPQMGHTMRISHLGQ